MTATPARPAPAAARIVMAFPASRAPGSGSAPALPAAAELPAPPVASEPARRKRSARRTAPPAMKQRRTGVMARRSARLTALSIVTGMRSPPRELREPARHGGVDPAREPGRRHAHRRHEEDERHEEGHLAQVEVAHVHVLPARL